MLQQQYNGVALKGLSKRIGKLSTAASLTLVADSAAPSGKYTLAATSGGATKSIGIDVTSADSTGSMFTFP